MRTLRGSAHFQNQNAGFHFAGFNGSAGGSGNFVAGGNFDFELRGFPLHDGNVGEHSDSNFSFAHGDECFHVGKKADFLRHDGSGGFAAGWMDTDQRLFYASNDGAGWTPQVTLGDRAKAGIEIDRKVLADIAATDEAASRAETRTRLVKRSG